MDNNEDLEEPAIVPDHQSPPTTKPRKTKRKKTKKKTPKTDNCGVDADAKPVRALKGDATSFRDLAAASVMAKHSFRKKKPNEEELATHAEEKESDVALRSSEVSGENDNNKSKDAPPPNNPNHQQLSAFEAAIQKTKAMKKRLNQHAQRYDERVSPNKKRGSFLSPAAFAGRDDSEGHFSDFGDVAWEEEAAAVGGRDWKKGEEKEKLEDNQNEEEKVEDQPLGEGWSMLEKNGAVPNESPVASAAVDDDYDDYSSITQGSTQGDKDTSFPVENLPPLAQGPKEALDTSLPSAQNRSRMVGKQSLFSTKNLLIGVLLLITLVLVVVLVVILTKDSSPSTPRSENNEVQAVCTSEDTTCAFLAGVLAPVHPERTWLQISIPGTCQHSALLWLSQSKEILTLDPVLVQQRYALATTYCELLDKGGDNDNRQLMSSGNAWESHVVYGGTNDECFGATNLGPASFNPNCAFQDIILNGQQQELSGTLAPELSIASSLQRVSIINSSVRGTIPSEYGRLSLIRLNLSNNQMSGPIPPWIVTPSMEELLLHGNQLTGSFAVDLDVAVNLRIVSVFNNSLTGDLDNVCSLFDDGALSVFAADINDVACNCCSSTLPPSVLIDPEADAIPLLPSTPHLPCAEDPACVFVMEAIEPVFPPSTRALINITGSCQNFAREWLRMDNNVMEYHDERIRQRYTMALLYCEWNVEEWNDSELWLSDLHECDWFVGEEWEPCNRLNEQYQILRFPGHQIQGTLPPELSMMSSLWEITLSNNLISGTIPEDYYKLSQLDTISLSNNLFEGPIADFVWFFEDMVFLDLAYNFFSGLLPEILHLTQPNLEVLLLESNDLSGTIPLTFNSLNWHRLHLDGNDLSGPVPAGLVAPNMEELHLHNNRLTGVFPADTYTIPAASELRELTLYNNEITGDLDNICNLFYNGKLEVLKVDLGSVSCQCCSSGSESNTTTLPAPMLSPVNQPSLEPTTALPVPVERPVDLPIPTLEPTGGSITIELPVQPPVETPAQSPVQDVGDDFIQAPYLGITTTPMDPYIKDDCFFGDNIQPHVINQCECYQAIDVIADDITELYSQVRANINAEIYSGTFTEPANSCDPINQALYWLSSGDTRDSGDLYQRYVMALTFIKMNGTDWDLNNLWLSDDSECIWFGLQCNSNFQLNIFALDTNNVHGSIPTEISQIQSLRTLSLTRNHVSGSIPTSIITMPHLENLVLYANNLIGSIPNEIGRATNLRSLRLENNLFFGFLTSELGKATALEELSIGFNDFWRRIPTEIGLLTNMRWLVMEDNRFSGTLPTEIGQMSKLEFFLLSKNLMTGTIPTELAQATELQEFRLAGTGIGGVFPQAMSQLTKLHHLEMGSNNFRGEHGTISTAVTDWFSTACLHLDFLVTYMFVLFYFQFTKGSIMTEFGLMTGLSWLSMNDNDITGTIPTELGNLANMTRMSFKDCMLSGTIPVELGRMSKLEYFSLSNNLMTGSVPAEVCALTGIDVLETDCSAPRNGVPEIACDPTCCTLCCDAEGENCYPTARTG